VAGAERRCGFRARYLSDAILRSGTLGLQQILIFACAARVDVLSMLRGNVAYAVSRPPEIRANEQCLRRKHVKGLTEVAVKKVADSIPDLALTELCIQVGLSKQVLHKHFPKIGAEAASARIRRQRSSAWCRLLSFARKLRKARLHLETAGRAFNRSNAFKATGTVIRPGSPEDELL
jgi:hypothetical protein